MYVYSGKAECMSAIVQAVVFEQQGYFTHLDTALKERYLTMLSIIGS